MHWGKHLAYLLALLASLALTTSANKLNGEWLVPGGDVEIDHSALSAAPLVCALTFDDGPDEHAYTLEVLRVLEEHGVPATFFVVGANVAAYPEQVAELLSAGHELGNHSYRHPRLTELTRQGQHLQLARVNAQLAGLGVAPRWFRPPYGEYNSTTLSVAANLGLSPVNWSVDPLDWQQPGSEVISRRVLSQTGPGAVILLHSTHRQTVDALPDIISGLRQQGYRFVTLSEWSRVISGNSELEELLSAPRPANPDWAERTQPDIVDGGPLDAVYVSLGRDELSSVEVPTDPVTAPLRVYCNFANRKQAAGLATRGGLAYLHEATRPESRGAAEFRSQTEDSADPPVPASEPMPAPPIAADLQPVDDQREDDSPLSTLPFSLELVISTTQSTDWLDEFDHFIHLALIAVLHNAAEMDSAPEGLQLTLPGDTFCDMLVGIDRGITDFSLLIDSHNRQLFAAELAQLHPDLQAIALLRRTSYDLEFAGQAPAWHLPVGLIPYRFAGESGELIVIAGRNQHHRTLKLPTRFSNATQFNLAADWSLAKTPLGETVDYTGEPLFIWRDAKITE